MKPPFFVRLLLVIPLTIMFVIALAVMSLAIPFVILFGKWTYKGRELY